MIILQFIFSLSKRVMIFERVTKNPKWKFFFTTSMKKSLFLVAIAIGFGISFVVWPNGFIFRPAYGAPTIGTDDLEDGAVTTEKIKDGEVKTQDLANGAVTKDKISPFALKLVVVQREVSFNLPPTHNREPLFNVIKMKL
jgi:hypothetical protein